MQLTLDRFGRMVLPKALREELGLQPGDALEAECQKDAIVLRPQARSDGVRREGRLLVFVGKAVGDLPGAAARMREERLNRVAGMRGRS